MNKGVRIKEYALNLSLSAVVMLLPVPGPLGPGSGRASVCVAVPEKNLSGRVTGTVRVFLCFTADQTPTQLRSLLPVICSKMDLRAAGELSYWRVGSGRVLGG
jgi:hypothetical protein